jgi:hypothetical protein
MDSTVAQEARHDLLAFLEQGEQTVVQMKQNERAVFWRYLLDPSMPNTQLQQFHPS